MAVIQIPYKPRNWARAAHDSLARFAVWVLHRRAGKTTALMNHHQRAATDDAWERRRLLAIRPTLTDAELYELMNPPGGRHYGHVMPYRSQAKLVVWDKLKYYAADIPGININEAELVIRYPRGHKVQLFGADNPDSLRGPGFSGISFDEFSQQPANIFSEVISKALGDHLGYAIFAGTIKGKDHLYKTYQATKEDPSWFGAWQDIDRSLATEDGITIQLLEQAMADDRAQIAQGLMTQAEYDQEWYLSPEAAIKGAIYGEEMSALRVKGQITRVPHDPALPVDTDWDLGVGDSTAIWFTQSLRTGEVRVIDYYEASREGLEHYSRVLKGQGEGNEHRAAYSYGRHWGPHDVAVMEFGTGKTRIATAREFGIVFDVTPRLSGGAAGVEVEEGINAVRNLLPRCWFDEKRTEAGREALVHYRRDFNTRLNEFKATPVHNWASHGADALRGLAVRHQIPVEAKKRQEPQFSPVFAWS